MRSLYLASVWLHILGAMTWAGGMTIFVLAVMPYFRRRTEAERAEFLAWFGRRFRVVSWWCLAILLVTGVFNLWARGVQPGDFLRPQWRSTMFGHLVLVKLTLVAVAVAITVLHERPGSRAYARWMGRALLVIAVVIVGLAVGLVRAS
ncbi:MAG: CopD family protein [Acidobacteriota bacterium]|nr:CopD family protein [Acidobacteriota bacterium]